MHHVCALGDACEHEFLVGAEGVLGFEMGDCVGAASLSGVAVEIGGVLPIVSTGWSGVEI